MIRVWVEVNYGSRDRFRAEVQAETIERAVHLVSASYPGCQCQVLFPINPETFFAGDEGALAAIRAAGRERGELFPTIRASA
jgi:hypothetical protein